MATVQKRAGTLKKKNFAGDRMNHLSTTVVPCEAPGLTRSCENRTPIGPNHRRFRHKLITQLLLVVLKQILNVANKVNGTYV